MLTAEGCRQRRQRLWQQLDPKPDGDHLVLSDPIHLMYLANFHVDPFSLGGRLPRLPAAAQRRPRQAASTTTACRSRCEQAHVEERRVVTWYDGQSPGHGPRQLAPLGGGQPVRQRPARPRPPRRPLRRDAHPHPRRTCAGARTPTRSPLLRRCMRATEAGHAWARANIKPGMTELDVYCGVNTACIQAAGQAVIVYGDFAVSPGPGAPRRPADRPRPASRATCSSSITPWSSAAIAATSPTRSSSAAEPNADQQRLYDLCIAAMAAGEKELQAGRGVPDGVPGGARRLREGGHGRATSRTTPATAWG